MKSRRAALCAVLLLSAACAQSPSAPSATTTPTVNAPAADLHQVGDLTLTNCQPNATIAGVRYLCAFSAIGINSGSRCATNVRGSLQTYRRAVFEPIIGTTNWSYGGMVRPGDQFAYVGDRAVVGDEADWVYHTEFLFDSIACP